MSERHPGIARSPLGADTVTHTYNFKAMAIILPPLEVDESFAVSLRSAVCVSWALL